MLRKRLESIYKIEFATHKQTLEELILEKLKEESTQIQLAKAAKAQEEGLVSKGKGKKNRLVDSDSEGEYSCGEDSAEEKEKEKEEEEDEMEMELTEEEMLEAIM